MPRNTAPQPFDVAAFQLPKKYEWMECERDDINEGLTAPLKIKVWVNPTIAEAEAEHALWKRRFEGMSENNDDAYYEHLAHIAPRIVEWNVQLARRDTGDLADVPPPAQLVELVNPAGDLSDADVGRRVFDSVLPMPTVNWLALACHTAHLGGETRLKLCAPPPPTVSGSGGETSTQPAIVPLRNGATPPSRRKSS